jgi:hypothetical protein
VARAMALRVDTPAWPPYFIGMLPRAAPPSGFIEPCLPSPGEQPPIGPDWVPRSSTTAIG